MIKDLLDMEKQAERLKENLIKDLASKIGAEAMDGVKAIPGTLNAVEVSSSSLFKTSLSPEAYIPQSQANIVSAKLKSAKTVGSLIAAIKDMSEKGYVTVTGGNNSYRTTLNPVTLKVLNNFLIENELVGATNQ